MVSTEQNLTARIDIKVRKAASEVWHVEAARDGFIFGLMTARAMVSPPGMKTYHELLTEVLGEKFRYPEHAVGCKGRGHKHGKAGCLERGCTCSLAVNHVEVP